MIDFLATNLVYQPITPTRNTARYNIPAVSPTVTDRANLKYNLKISVPSYTGSADYVPLVEIPNREKPPFLDGTTTIYEGASFILDSILDSLLKRQKPDYRQTNISIVAGLSIPYLLQEVVSQGDTIISTTNLPAKYALKCGFSPEDFAQWGVRFFSNYLAAQKQFLTWQLNNKPVAYNQEEYLYFLLNFTPVPTTIKLRVKALYSDYTEEVFSAKQISGVKYMQVLCIPCGAFLFDFQPTKTLHSYQVWLSNEADNRISEVRTYIIQDIKYAQKREILFSNSFSCFDTLSLTGVSTESLQVDRFAAYREKPAYKPNDWSELYVAYRDATRTLTVSTGFLQRNVVESLRALDELFLSEEVYLITDRNHEQLELISNTLLDHSDTTDLVARELQFRLVRTVTGFSRLPIAPPTASRPTYWKPFDTTHVLDAYGKRTGYVVAVKLVLYYADDDTPVHPHTQKPNNPNDPDYIPPTVNPTIVAGYTPYPSAAISRPSTFVRNNCTLGKVGQTIQITIPAGKYGGEQPGLADSLAEAEYNSLNTQENVNANAVCLYLSAAISRPSTFVRNNCASNATGATWTIVVPYGAYTSTVSQSEADTLANNYANSLDTQANANTNAVCVPVWQYTYTPPAGYFHIRFGHSWINIMGGKRGIYYQSNAAGTTNTPITGPSNKLYLAESIANNISIPATDSAPGFAINPALFTIYTDLTESIVGNPIVLKVYKNGALWVERNRYIDSASIWDPWGNLPIPVAGDLLYVEIY